MVGKNSVVLRAGRLTAIVAVLSGLRRFAAVVAVTRILRLAAVVILAVILGVVHSVVSLLLGHATVVGALSWVFRLAAVVSVTRILRPTAIVFHAVILGVVHSVVSFVSPLFFQPLFPRRARAASVTTTNTASTAGLITVTDFTHQLATVLSVGPDTNIEAADGRTLQLTAALGGTSFRNAITACLTTLGTLGRASRSLTEVLLKTGLVRSSCMGRDENVSDFPR